MSDDLTTALRELAESVEQSPQFSGADIRQLAQRRGRRRRTIAALGGTAAVASLGLALVLGPGGPGPGRQDMPATQPTSTLTRRPAPDAEVALSSRLLVAGGRRMPVSSGLARTPTPTGRMTVVSRVRVTVVSGAVVGRPPDFRYRVPWVIRLRADDGTTTAVFGMITDGTAPGVVDLTSGWIGLRTADAKWLYDRLRTGSVVDIEGHAPAVPWPTPSA
ncbi:L,D-transpeptidase family protein [Streptomyces broussonetiae]|uniref:L,D-transpeptidase family protein n=1 Tax=Streptomyces broussonetiae TaxID=2686304 RepID=A0A6I6NGG7_9ACTN|nr:L,D-transpeptidase [Streptomyces broussonetiae]QHA08045.1 L,D-transpeptidase family protein [Streptomyces broussonetiae]